ncbi:hypothetical protein EXIGLDRAFT_482403 [Exidia glandulosa HHB12029]|uniref:Zinc finger CHCC-type domain-containing protein n=1 Tax=Exidia glandulosa HHB12029 TaxID=1314781 RepID=A0A165PHW5_EXIGL|nr:hypothetical protein EXIGLDRAFT_482403 [Exidia glandulosa HHB12029]
MITVQRPKSATKRPDAAGEPESRRPRRTNIVVRAVKALVDPVIFVAQRHVTCDGGVGLLSHRKMVINLDGVRGPQTCGHCGLRFQHRQPRPLRATPPPSLDVGDSAFIL